jgi:hypothetical protein
MGRRSRSWRSRVWLAWFAVALNAVAPTLTQAAAWLQGRPLGIAVEAGRPIGWSAPGAHAGHAHAHHRGHDSSTHGEHCPFCFTHAGSFALPSLPAHAPMLPARAGRTDVATVPESAPRIAVRLAAQPRAPPAIG